MGEFLIIESLVRHIGQTVTIFTESGGISGSGFTGVLAAVGEKSIKLITDIGAPPACPVGSACDFGPGCAGGGGFGGGCGGGYGGFGGGYGGVGYGYGASYGGFGYGVGYGNSYGYGGGCGSGCGCNPCDNIVPRTNWLGSIAEIPDTAIKYILLDCICYSINTILSWFGI